jgi:hypothetical protein
MSLRERIEADLKTAMKARDDVTRDTLRMVLSSVKKVEIDSGRATTDADVLGVLKTAAKTRQESAEQFAAAGRTDLAQKEQSELAVVARYLPQQMSEDDVRALVQRLISELGITSKKDLGKLMKVLMSRHKDELDGKLAQRIAGELVE